MNRQDAEKRGHWGERRAAWWLRIHGWRILGSRVKLKVGEIDLIARRGRIVAFIEVKTRATTWELDHAVDAHRMRRVVNAVRAVSHDYMRPGDDIRIDLILIAPRCWPRHLTNILA
jgi:putative endonuclease